MKLNTFHGEVWINAHPEIMEDCLRANEEPVDGGYGNDGYSKRAKDLIGKYFDDEIFVTFAISGTAANVLALKSMTNRWSAILCASQAHLNVYEAGATEFSLGNKILSIDCPDGKLTPALIDRLLLTTKKYKYKPEVVAITNPTEYGTVYTNEEIKVICDHAHSLGLYVYLDGARIGNAVVALNTDLKEMIEKTDVDAFSFGGTKAGAMFGEMVVFRRKAFANYLEYACKQSFQHMSKSKFLGVQIVSVLERNFWIDDAIKSNAAAKYLEKKLVEKGVEIYYKVESNMVFCVVSPEKMKKICEKYDSHYWDEINHVVRFATTYLTTEKEIDDLVALF
ncbi:MAG: threonine aldolase [Clostridia bacterium]|nr:threonine aldolase [Clostridia bacterium]